MRRMMTSVARPLAVLRSVPGGSTSARRNGRPTRTVTRPPGCGSFWPRGQTPFEPADADRHDRRAGAQGQHGDAVARLLERAVGLRVPSGKTNRTWPSSRIRSASRNASTSAAPRSTGWTPPLRASQPTTGQSNSSFLPSQWIRRPSVGRQPRARARPDRSSRRGSQAMMTGPVARDRVDRPFDADPRHRRGRRAGAPNATVRMSGVIELSIGSGADGASACGASSPVGHRRASRVADRVDDRVHGVLEAVAVGRDDPRVGRGPERRHGRFRSSSSRRRRAVEDRLRPPGRPGPGRAPRSGGRPAPRPTLEEDLEVRVGQHDRPDVAAGHDDPAGRRRAPAAARAAPRAAPGPPRPRRRPRRPRVRGRRRCGRCRRRRRGTAGRSSSGDELDLVDERDSGPPGRRPRRRGARPARSPRGRAGPCRRSGSRALAAAAAPTLLLPDDPGPSSATTSPRGPSAFHPSAAG